MGKRNGGEGGIVGLKSMLNVNQTVKCDKRKAVFYKLFVEHSAHTPDAFNMTENINKSLCKRLMWSESIRDVLFSIGFTNESRLIDSVCDPNHVFNGVHKRLSIDRFSMWSESIWDVLFSIGFRNDSRLIDSLCDPNQYEMYCFQ